MFEFTVPGGDYDYDYDNENHNYIGKPLVFTEKKLKDAKAVIKEFVADGTSFTMVFTP